MHTHNGFLLVSVHQFHSESFHQPKTLIENTCTSAIGLEMMKLGSKLLNHAATPVSTRMRVCILKRVVNNTDPCNILRVSWLAIIYIKCGSLVKQVTRNVVECSVAVKNMIWWMFPCFIGWVTLECLSTSTSFKVPPLQCSQKNLCAPSTLVHPAGEVGLKFLSGDAGSVSLCGVSSVFSQKWPQRDWKGQKLC